jgi:hypothetical protein
VIARGRAEIDADFYLALITTRLIFLICAARKDTFVHTADWFRIDQYTAKCTVPTQIAIDLILSPQFFE